MSTKTFKIIFLLTMCFFLLAGIICSELGNVGAGTSLITVAFGGWTIQYLTKLTRKQVTRIFR